MRRSKRHAKQAKQSRPRSKTHAKRPRHTSVVLGDTGPDIHNADVQQSRPTAAEEKEAPDDSFREASLPEQNPIPGASGRHRGPVAETEEEGAIEPTEDVESEEKGA